MLVVWELMSRQHKAHVSRSSSSNCRIGGDHDKLHNYARVRACARACACRHTCLRAPLEFEPGLLRVFPRYFTAALNILGPCLVFRNADAYKK